MPTERELNEIATAIADRNNYPFCFIPQYVHVTILARDINYRILHALVRYPAGDKQ